jgi:hypothetical protein
LAPEDKESIMSMKDLLNKMTELQGTTANEETVSSTGKKVLTESAEPVAKESTKPSLKSMFNSLLAEAEQVTIQPAQQNTQVIKQGDKTLGTVTNPSLANQIKQSIGKGEMSLVGDDDLNEEGADTRSPLEVIDDLLYDYESKRTPKGAIWRRANQFVSIIVDPNDNEFVNWSIGYIENNKVNTIESGNDPISEVAMVVKNFKNKRERTLDESKLNEKAVSKSQQQAAGAALAAKRGDAPKSKLKGASKEMTKMPAKELEKFAKTKHKGLPDKKQKTDEAAMPTHDGDFGAGLGAGRNSKTLEAKKAKPDFLDLDKDGNKKESMKKAAADKQKVSTMKKTNEAKAKPDFLDLDKDGDKKELMKKAADAKKKKTVKEGANPTEAARLLGKAHALAKDPFACKYESGTSEAQSYLAGYKEGLDECYGSGSSDMGQEQMPAVIPGMDSMGMAPAEDDFEEDALIGGSETFDMADDFGYKDEQDTMMAFEAWDRQLNALLNEGKMKEVDMDMKEMSDAEFKKAHGKSKADMKKDLSGSDKKKTVKEGVTVAINKDIENAPDSVTVTAQGDEADQLLAMIKQAGMGIFGGDDNTSTSGLGLQTNVETPAPSAPQSLGDVGDHDSMMSLLQKMTAGSQDYEDEESMDDEHVHGHPDAACDVCGSSDCGCDDSEGKALVVGEDETADQREFEVSEANAPDSGESESTADEDAEAEEDKALAGADSDDEDQLDEGQMKQMAHEKAESMSKEDYISWAADHGMGRSEAIEFWNSINDDEEELTEWANDANNQRTEDDSYYEDIDFMTKVISGGLNNQKKDQTTLPHTKVAESSLLDDWKKLSGIR